MGRGMARRASADLGRRADEGDTRKLVPQGGDGWGEGEGRGDTLID